MPNYFTSGRRYNWNKYWNWNKNTRKVGIDPSSLKSASKSLSNDENTRIKEIRQKPIQSNQNPMLGRGKKYTRKNIRKHRKPKLK